MLEKDLRFAVRSLLKSRLFVLVAVASLTLGIGATSTAFSLFDAVALRPLPYRDASRLVDIHETSTTQLCAYCSVGTSWASFVDWRTRARSFDDIQAYRELPLAVSGTGAAERVSGAIVSGGFFRLLGLTTIVGRTSVPMTNAPMRPRWWCSANRSGVHATAATARSSAARSA